MPELPEVETTKNGIEPYIKGIKIVATLVRQARLRWPVSPEIVQLKHQTIKSIRRRAKYLILELDNGYLLIHLGMSGVLKIVPQSTLVKKHDHIDFILENGLVLRYHDPRRFGCCLWVDSITQCRLLQKLGVEPLSDDFNPTYLWRYSRNKNTALKALIMNNQVLVGVGNIYACEALFLARLHPELTASLLTKKQASRLVWSIKKILHEAILKGGTTLKDFHQPDGNSGYFVQELRVYGRKNQPCLICGTPIVSKVIRQRNSFFCPKCQVI